MHSPPPPHPPVLPPASPSRSSWWDTLKAPCRAWGGDRDPPFECPIDYWIDLNAWGVNSTTMRYRPASFLAHPRVSLAIRESRWVGVGRAV